MPLPVTSPSISILIPVYNVADFVDECLQSILGQIDQHAEIIVMNDASTDASWAVLQRYREHPQVTLLQAPHNRGLSGTRNALLAHARHDYIWFIDSDDAMHGGAYRQVQQALGQFDVDLLGGHYMAWRGEHKRLKKAFVGPAGRALANHQQAFLKNIVKNNSNHVWNKIYKKTVIEQIAFQQGRKFEDIYYMTDLSEVIKSFAFIDYPLIDYRERQGSIIQNLDERYVNDYLGAFLHRVAAVRQNGPVDTDFGHYLYYKTYNRYAGLVKKLQQNQQTDRLKSVRMQFEPSFEAIFSQISPAIGWFRYQKLKFKHRQTQSILNALTTG